QHGAASRPPAVRTADLPVDRRRAVEHPARGAAVRPEPAPAGLEAAPGPQRPRGGQGPGAADRQDPDDEEQRRVPRRDRQGTDARVVTPSTERSGLPTDCAKRKSLPVPGFTTQVRRGVGRPTTTSEPQVDEVGGATAERDASPTSVAAVAVTADPKFTG